MSTHLKTILESMPVTITARLTVGIFFLVGAVLLLLFVFIPAEMEKQFISGFSQTAQAEAHIISQTISIVYQSGAKTDIDEILESMGQHEYLEFAVVHDSDDNYCAAYNLAKAKKADYMSIKNSHQLSQNSKIYQTIIPLKNKGGQIGQLYLGFELADAGWGKASYMATLTWISAVLFALGIITIIALKSMIAGPINQITNVIEQIRDGDVSIRAPKIANDEIGMLALSLNSMVGHWEASWKAWGNLNNDLEKRVADRTLALEDEIVERRRAEEELRLFAAKLERSNRELEDFAFVASHDLQEPLRKVQAFGDRLKAACGDELSEKGRNYLERMQSASNRMQILIKDLLTFSRVASKAQPFVPVDLKNTALEVISDMEISIERLGGKVDIGELGTIEADPLQIRQLIQNLIGNGIKFHKENDPPVVKIYGETVERQAADQDQALYNLIVEDNGIGFDEKYSDRIFTVFQRLHGRSEYEGTGLGLAVCRKIVERHGGTIIAKSQPGQGAKFIATMPIMQEKEETKKVNIMTDRVEPGENNKTEPGLRPVQKGMETSFMVPCP